MTDYSAIPAEDLLERLDLKGIRPSSGGSEFNFSCFGGEHSEGGSAYINVDSKLWMCHGCHRKGNAVSLIMEVLQITKPQADRWLRDAYGIQFDEPTSGSMVAETEARFAPPLEPHVPTPPPASWLKSTRTDWYLAEQDPQPHEVYMFARGFEPATLKEWEIGYDFDSDRITIPIHDLEGNLVGVKARDWTGGRQPKYLVLGDRGDSLRYGFEPYDPSLVVFGLHRNRHEHTVVLLEGELNALALSQMGVPRPIAMGMSYFSDRQAKLIAREADEVVVYTDYGEAGYSAAWGRVDAAGRKAPGIVGMLEPHVRVRVVVPGPDDPANLLETGRCQEALDLIDSASTTLAMSLPFG